MLHKRTQKDLALSIVSGILFGTSYIPFPAWAIFFCFVPLWLVWMNADSTKKVFFTGWVMQFVMVLVGFNWVAHTVSEFGHMPLWVGILVLMLFCSLTSLNIPIAGVLWHLLFKDAPRWAKILGLVTLTAITERLYPMIFDFHLGYTWLWMKFPAFQIADVVGFFGLSTLTIAFNGLLLWAYLDSRRRMLAIASFVALFGGLNIWGHLKEQALPKPDKNVRAMIVQANIGDENPLFEKHGQAARPLIFESYSNLTMQTLKSATAPVDFILWPETAFPDALMDPNLSAGFPARLPD